ncbi:MAG TPA: glycosyltransferase family 39 protein [Candidatus Ozemobacteraceae bacterium]|nr:glycosyltransferase family 39 protein [Candidatus Ozemobacteraceae bacterium]
MNAGHPRGGGWFLLILVAGAVLRFAFLGTESLWEDEIGSLIIARMPVGEILGMHRTTNEFHPPLYFLFLHVWIRLFGETEIAVRSLSAVCSTLSLGLVYVCGRRLFGREAGLLAMGLLALSTFHIRYAQEARNYALTVLLGIASFHTLARCLERLDLRRAAAWVVSTTALLYTNNLGLLVPFAQNLFVFLCAPFPESQDKRRWLLAQGAVLILFAPWLPVFLSQLASAQKSFWISPPDLQSMLDTLLEYGGSLVSCHATREGDRTAAVVTLCLVIGSALASFSDNGESPRDRRLRIARNPALCLTLLWFAVPLGIPYLLSLVGQPVFIPRITILASVALFLLAARGLSLLPGERLKKLLAGATAASMILSLFIYYTTPDKDQWREAAALVAESSRPGETIVVASARCRYSFEYYFAPKDRRILPFPVSSHEINDKTVSELMPLIGHAPRLQLVLSYHTFGNANLLLERLAPIYRLIGHREVFGIQVIRLETRATEGAAE